MTPQRSLRRTSLLAASLATAGALTFGTAAPSGATTAPAPAPVIDLLVLYTPEALKARGGKEQLAQAVERGIASMNDALSRSRIPGTIRVIGLEETPVPESKVGRSRTGFDWIAGYGPGVRNIYDADLVSVVVTGGEGIASSPYVPIANVNGAEAWSVVGNDWLEPVPGGGEAGVFAHELGHNLGATHDWGTTPDTRGANSQRHGYVNPNGLIDIMAYTTSPLCAPNRCNRQPYYSNPDVTVGGLPFGQRGGTKPSDIASVFTKTIPVVAGYRTATMVQFQYNEDNAARPSLFDPLGALNRLAAQRYLPGTYRSARIENAPSAARAGYTPAEVDAAVKAAKASCTAATNCETRDGARYVTLPAKILPIMLPLLDFGSATGTLAFVRPLVDLTSPLLRVLLDPARGTALAPADLISRLSNAVGEGVRAASTGTGEGSRYLAPATRSGDTVRSVSGDSAPVGTQAGATAALVRDTASTASSTVSPVTAAPSTQTPKASTATSETAKPASSSGASKTSEPSEAAAATGSSTASTSASGTTSGSTAKSGASTAEKTTAEKTTADKAASGSSTASTDPSGSASSSDKAGASSAN
ncbi:hypothetical protein GCM10009551_099630 [Nocardiopsis tropica]|uniref:M12 family metallo-peptidase n=1 Tax=Tsukamurella strandjordii TaxID=147577 RepID=UPI0031D072DE